MAEPEPSQTTVTTKPEPAPAATKPSLKDRLKLFFWKLVSLLLVISLVISIVLWKPWQANVKAGERTVSVAGSATITAAPDEFVFSPSYTFTNADKQAALAEMTQKSNDIVAKLKGLGVPSNKIKVDSSGFNNVYSIEPNGDSTYNLNLTVTLSTQALAQKVQDYLITTGPSGAVSPQANFSTAKQKQLEGQARDKAEQDARAKADQSAKNLGFSVGKVKSVDDSGFASFGGCGARGLCQGANLSATDAATPSLAVQPGENDLPYSVTVTYYIH